jgi:hypothetical protein
VSAGYLTALTLTLAIEIPLVLLVLRRAPHRRVVFVAVVGNLFTHLGVHFLLTAFHLPLPAFEVVAECFAFAIEAAIYAAATRPLSPWYAVAASALANGGSYVLGLLLSF